MKHRQVAAAHAPPVEVAQQPAEGHKYGPSPAIDTGQLHGARSKAHGVRFDG